MGKSNQKMTEKLTTIKETMYRTAGICSAVEEHRFIDSWLSPSIAGNPGG